MRSARCTAHGRWSSTAAFLALVFTLAACQGAGSETGEAAAHRPLTGGPWTDGSVSSDRLVESRSPPLGFKWNWAQFSLLEPYLRDSGGGTTFYEFSWCDVEPTRGGHDWTRIDDVVQATRELGYELMLKVRVGSCWVTGDQHRAARRGGRKLPSAMPEDLASYQAFIGTVVRRYSAVGVRVYALENEVDSPLSWSGTVDQYRRLVISGAEAARRADPQARVLDAGITSISYGPAVAGWLLERGDTDGAVDFYQGVFRRRVERSGFVFPPARDAETLKRVLRTERAVRARDYLQATFGLIEERVVDAYQLHYYEPWDHLLPVLAYLRSNLGANVPIEGWEIGVAWPGDSYDEQVHADETVKLLITLLGSDVQPAVYLPVAWTPDGKTRNEIWRGLLLPDGGRRPAARALSSLAELVSRPGARWRLLRRPGVTGAAFEEGGTTTLIVWTEHELRLSGTPPPGTTIRSLEGDDLLTRGQDRVVGRRPIVATSRQDLDDLLQWLKEAAST